MKPKLAILGTRGIPANHGGFETFTESFSTYLHYKGWDVTVYCQRDGNGMVYKDYWNGIRRIHIPVPYAGAKGTIYFDWKSTLHSLSNNSNILTLGYNTAVFGCLFRIKGIKNIINMDGIEWRRRKWNKLERSWLYINEKLGAWLGNHLIADHPEIKRHLESFVRSEKVSVIPYSAEIIECADESLINKLSLEIGNYLILIARPERENSILEIVKAYSFKPRGVPLVILGQYLPGLNSYHREVLEAASPEVKFVGAIYDKKKVKALRFFSRFYIHGHTVGGTNPSLVEALGAGSAILAHNNKFNRWVAGDGARYFNTIDECSREIDTLLTNDTLVRTMKRNSLEKFTRDFTPGLIHEAYEKMLKKHFNI